MELRVEVVRIEELTPHDNADTLDIAKVWDYPVIVKRGNFAPGDLAVYVPIDAVVPFTKYWEWLHGGKERDCRVKAKRLRGVFSMGLLVPVSEYWVGSFEEGFDCAEILGITKYEPPPAQINSGPNAGHGRVNPFALLDLPEGLVKFTDVENIRRWPKVFQEGERVVLTEKIHGANFRAYHDGKSLYVGSHNFWLKGALDDGSPANNMYWAAAREYNLEPVLATMPGVIYFGEIYGSGVQDLTYGCKPGEKKLAFYDAYNVAERRYLGMDEFIASAGVLLGLPIVPLVASGAFSKSMVDDMTTGRTMILTTDVRQPVDQIREGVVVRPMHERFDLRLGRVVLKSINPEYLLRKKGSETKEFLAA